MTILGVDPGTIHAGYSILQDGPTILESGILKLQRGKAMQDRLGEIYTFFKGRIQKYNVKIIALETAFIGKNPTVYLKLGYVRGILYLLAHQYDCVLREYSPCEVKQAITGVGSATKEDVAFALAKIFPQYRDALKTTKNYDLTDALAVGVTGLWKK